MPVLTKPIIHILPERREKRKFVDSRFKTISELAEPAMGKNQLSQEFLAKIDAVFADCIEKLKGKKLGYSSANPSTFESNKKGRVDKFAELVGLLQNAIEIAGAQGEFTVKNSPIDQNKWDYINMDIEIYSKTTGFYARYAIRTNYNDSYLLMNPGINDFDCIDIAINGANNENAKQMMLVLLDKIANFKNPDVWKNQEGWAEALSEGLVEAARIGTVMDFHRWILHIAYAAENYASGTLKSETIRVISNTYNSRKSGEVSVKRKGSDRESTVWKSDYIHNMDLGTESKIQEVKKSIMRLFKEISQISQPQ